MIYPKGTHIDENLKVYLNIPNRGNTGFKYKMLAVICQDVFQKFDGIALEIDVWKDLYDGVVETVECLSQGTSWSLVPRGCLQYTFLMKDAWRYGYLKWHPWGQSWRWVIPTKVLTLVPPIS
jgi:hypothetical protein